MRTFPISYTAFQHTQSYISPVYFFFTLLYEFSLFEHWSLFAHELTTQSSFCWQRPWSRVVLVHSYGDTNDRNTRAHSSRKKRFKFSVSSRTKSKVSQKKVEKKHFLAIFLINFSFFCSTKFYLARCLVLISENRCLSWYIILPRFFFQVLFLLESCPNERFSVFSEIVWNAISSAEYQSVWQDAFGCLHISLAAAAGRLWIAKKRPLF